MTRKALTLAELVVVLFILVALAGLATPLCSEQMAVAAQSTTLATLTRTRDALEQYWLDTKFLTLDGVLTTADEAHRFDIQWLFNNPVTGDRTLGFDRTSRIGWNGPYLLNTTTEPAAIDGLIDGWQHNLVVQDVNPSATIRDVRIVSPGPDGLVHIPAAMPTAALTNSNIGDDLYVSLLLR